MREIKYIVIHCADTYAEMDIGKEEIREWHLDRGFSDIGYNFIIRRSGELEGGRDLDQDGDFLEEVGAHVRGHNTNSLGICLVGGKPRFNFTKPQFSTLQGVLNTLTALFPDAEVLGHCDLDPSKDCPGFPVKEWYQYGVRG